MQHKNSFPVGKLFCDAVVDISYKKVNNEKSMFFDFLNQCAQRKKGGGSIG